MPRHLAALGISLAVAVPMAASLFACAPAPVAQVAPVAPEVPAAPTAAPSSTAPAAPLPAPSYELHGKLLGHDGKPMKLAHVHRDGARTAVDASGSFSVTAPGPGFLELKLTGVDHADLLLGVYFDGKPVDVEITLGTWELRPAGFSHATVGTYVSKKEGPPVPFAFGRGLSKQPSGLLGAVLVLNENDGLYYGLDDIARSHRINGQGDSFFWDTHYNAYAGRIQREKGAYRVVVDPAQLPPSGLAPHLTFADPTSRSARLTTLRLEAELRAKAPVPPAGDWRSALVAAIANEKDPDVASGMRIASLVPADGLDAQRDGDLARELVDHLAASSPLWGLAPGASITAVDLLGHTPEREAFLEAVTTGLREKAVAAEHLRSRIRAASRAGDDAAVARLYASMRERFAGTDAAHAVVLYNPKRSTRPNHEVPDFDWPVLPDIGASAKGNVSKASLRGKVVLIDFWGFWCIPCVHEMANIHDTYARHAAEGFTVVSFAVKSPLPGIKNFRAGTWPMPWTNVHLKEAEEEAVIATFEVKSYPTPILVGRDGKIVAMGDELRGEELERVVVRALAK